MAAGEIVRTIEPQKRNILINGNMDFWQRGTSFTSIAAFAYAADRFQYAKAGAMVHDISRSTDVPTQVESGFESTYSLLVDCTTADASIAASDYTTIRQSIEGYNAVPIYGKTFTLSFWVKATKTGIYCCSFVNDINTRSYVAEYTINAADTWEKKEITVTHDLTGTWETGTSRGMQVFWTLASGTTFQGTADTWQAGLVFATANQVNATDNTVNNFRIAQVMLHEGDSALSFRRAGDTIQDELAKCQRYYEKSYNVDVAPGTNTSTGLWQSPLASVSSSGNITTISFKVYKRANPVIVGYTQSGTINNWVSMNSGGGQTNRTLTFTQISPRSFSGYLNGSGTDILGIGHWTLDAEL